LNNVDKPYGFLFVRMVSNFNFEKIKLKLKGTDLYFVMIMKLRKSSLREMMRTGLVTDRIKKKVLEGLKPIVVKDSFDTHGDLKDADHFLIFFHFRFKTNKVTHSLKPENCLVDYSFVMDANGLNGELHFEMVVGDWGTSGYHDKHFGGTPMYASSQAFQASQMKDIFAFGRIAMELHLDESGKTDVFCLN
jgi:hypothetical protein